MSGMGMYVLLFVVFAAGLAGGWFAAKRKYGGFNVELKEFFEKSARSGRRDFHSRFTPSRAKTGEAARVTEDINDLMGFASKTFSSASDVGFRLVKVSDAVKSDSAELTMVSKRSSEQAERVAAAMHEMSATINDIAKNIAETAALGDKMRNSASHAANEVRGSSESIKLMAGDVSVWAQTNRALSEATTRIYGIINVIKDIADQTNLLALNAAIEAARAGDQGRGFAVVAEEVRKLADKTTKSTGEIAVMIEDIKRKADSSIENMGNTMQNVSKSIARADNAEESLSAILKEAGEIADMASRVAASIEEQSKVSEDVLKNTEQSASAASGLSGMAAKVAASGEKVASSAVELYNLLCDIRKDQTDFEMERMLYGWSTELSERINGDIKNNRISIDALFDEHYRPTTKDRFETSATAYFEGNINGLLRSWTASDSRIVYVVAMDKNGYMPTHAMKERSGLMLKDKVALTGAKSRTVIGQAFRRPMDAGGQFVVDVARPLEFSGRHWGCLRIGYLPEQGI